MGVDIKRFTNQPVDSSFLCPICNDVYVDPIQCPEEHIYCEKCIKQWLSRKSSCPLDQKGLAVNDLKSVPRVFKNMLDNLELKCEFAGVGCPVTTTLSSIKDHEDHCSFSGAGEGKLDKMERQIRDLTNHVKSVDEEMMRLKIEITQVKEDAERKGALINDLETKLAQVADTQSASSSGLKELAEMAIKFAEQTGDVCGKWSKLVKDIDEGKSPATTQQSASSDLVKQLAKEVTISPRVREALDGVDYELFHDTDSMNIG